MIPVLFIDRDETRARPFSALKPRILRPSDDLQAVFDEGREALWIVPKIGSLKHVLKLRGGRRGNQRVLVLVSVDRVRLNVLQALFEHVVCRPEGGSFLPPRQLATVLAGSRPGDYFIGGFVNRADRIVVLYRGDLSSLVVPLGWFNSPTAKADPTKLEITHWGQAVRLGDFEAFADAVLYDFDPVARLRLEERDRLVKAKMQKLQREQRRKPKPSAGKFASPTSSPSP